MARIPKKENQNLQLLNCNTGHSNPRLFNHELFNPRLPLGLKRSWFKNLDLRSPGLKYYPAAYYSLEISALDFFTLNFSTSMWSGVGNSLLKSLGFECPVQVNLCQKLLFLHQLNHNMTTDCSWNYHENYKRRTWAEHVLHL